jgi:putative glutathione S-transferase
VPGGKADGLQYTKSHGDINPKAITPIGPFPDVEEGSERDRGMLRVGGLKHPAVLEYEGKIPSP